MMVDVEDEYSRLANVKLSLEETVEQVRDFFRPLVMILSINDITFLDGTGNRLMLKRCKSNAAQFHVLKSHSLRAVRNKFHSFLPNSYEF